MFTCCLFNCSKISQCISSNFCDTSSLNDFKYSVTPGGALRGSSNDLGDKSWNIPRGDMAEGEAPNNSGDGICNGDKLPILNLLADLDGIGIDKDAPGPPGGTDFANPALFTSFVEIDWNAQHTIPDSSALDIECKAWNDGISYNNTTPVDTTAAKVIPSPDKDKFKIPPKVDVIVPICCCL